MQNLLIDFSADQELDKLYKMNMVIYNFEILTSDEEELNENDMKELVREIT